MANKIINIDVKVDSNIDATTKDIQDLNGAIQQTTKNTKQLDDAQDGLGKSMQSSGKSVLDNGGAMGLLNDATGGLAMTIKDAVEALDLFKTSNAANTVATEAGAVATETATVATGELTIAQRILNVVLNANPYVLIATLITAITAAMYGWFSITQEQKDALKESENAINLNKISTDNLKTSIENTATETEQSNNLEIARAKATGKSEQEIQKLIQAQKDLVISTSITNASLARQQQLEAENNLRILRQKIGTGGAFFGGLTDEEEAQIKSAQDALKSATDFYTQQQSLVDISINDAQINRFEVTAENNKKIQEENQKHLDKLSAQNKKAADDEKKRREGIANDAIAFQGLVNSHEFDDKKLARQEQIDLDTQFFKDVEAMENQSYETKKANADSKKKIDETAQKAQEDALNQGSTSLKQAASLLGESTDAGKTAAIAATTIDTYQSATASYNAFAGIPIVGPALGFAAAGVAVAAGIANVKKIISVKTPKGGANGSTPSAGGTPLVPQTKLFGSSNNANNVDTNNLPVPNNQNITVKAVVSETEITNSQTFISKVKNSAAI